MNAIDFIVYKEKLQWYACDSSNLEFAIYLKRMD